MAFIKVGDATPILKVLSSDELKKEQEKIEKQQEQVEEEKNLNNKK
jgi:hypothetical protein